MNPSSPPLGWLVNCFAVFLTPPYSLSVERYLFKIRWELPSSSVENMSAREIRRDCSGKLDDLHYIIGLYVSGFIFEITLGSVCENVFMVHCE